MLEGALKPWARKQAWIFQKNSARATPEWLKNEVSRFIFNAQWPPKSPDANPLDYCGWGILESKVGTKKYQSVDQLKKALRRQWNKITQSHFRGSEWRFH